jgi:hypothetical protein
MMSHARKEEINALLVERRGYEARGLRDRIAAVDAALAALGHEIETTSLCPETERATAPRARKRRKP